jgi:hypothetical protein
VITTRGGVDMIADFEKRTDFIDISNPTYVYYIHDNEIQRYAKSGDIVNIRKFILSHLDTSWVRFIAKNIHIKFFISIFSDRIYKGVVMKKPNTFFVCITDELQDGLSVFDGEFLVVQDLVLYFDNMRKGVSEKWIK